MNALEWLGSLWQQLLVRPLFIALATLLGGKAGPLSDWLIQRTSQRLAPEFAEDCKLQWLADLYGLPSWLRLQSATSIFFSSQILEGRRRSRQRTRFTATVVDTSAQASSMDANVHVDPPAPDFDYLTGLAGRHRFEKRLARLATPFSGGTDGLSVIVIDLDHFQTINGELGRLGGNAVLREIGRRIRQTLRPRDYLGRVGADVFAVALPDTSPIEAIGMAERLRLTCELSLVVSSVATLSVSGSVGLACQTPETRAGDLLECARAATQEAKKGRRVCVFGSLGSRE